MENPGDAAMRFVLAEYTYPFLLIANPEEVGELTYN